MVSAQSSPASLAESLECAASLADLDDSKRLTEATREQLYKAVYEDPEWTGNIGPRIGEIMDRERILVTRIVPTSRSVLQ